MMTLKRITVAVLLYFYHLSAVYAVNLDFSQVFIDTLPIPASLGDKTLGSSLVTMDTTAFVSAMPDKYGQTGSVYIYDAQNHWRIIAELNSSSPTDNFAAEVVAHQSFLFVSASMDDEQAIDSGAVHIFEKTVAGWVRIQKLMARDAQAKAAFGQALFVKDNVLYVGAPLHQQGKVYLFVYDSATAQWIVQSTLEPTDKQAQHFGASITANEQYLAIGAPHTDAIDCCLDQQRKQPRFAISKGDTFDPGLESGAIFVYEKVANSWKVTERLGASNRETSDHLGEQLAVIDNQIIASIKEKDVFDELRAGAIYIYQKGQDHWQEKQALVADEPQLAAAFGQGFSVLDEQLLVGAPRHHTNGFSSGQAYVFNRDSLKNWQLAHLLESNLTVAHDRFGSQVVLGKKYSLVASKKSVYIYQHTPIQLDTAVYYPSQQVLQLSAVSVDNLGVFSANFQVVHVADKVELILIQATVVNRVARLNYDSSTGQLEIAKLVVSSSVEADHFYRVNLQKNQQASSFQFDVIQSELIHE